MWWKIFLALEVFPVGFAAVCAIRAIRAIRLERQFLRGDTLEANLMPNAVSMQWHVMTQALFCVPVAAVLALLAVLATWVE